MTTLAAVHPMADDKPPLIWRKEDHGPNYRDEREEAEAMRKQRSTSWFDAGAFTLLIVCVAIIPVLWLLSELGRLAWSK